MAISLNDYERQQTGAIASGNTAINERIGRETLTQLRARVDRLEQEIKALESTVNNQYSPSKVIDDFKKDLVKRK